MGADTTPDGPRALAACPPPLSHEGDRECSGRQSPWSARTSPCWSVVPMTFDAPGDAQTGTTPPVCCRLGGPAGGV